MSRHKISDSFCNFLRVFKFSTIYKRANRRVNVPDENTVKQKYDDKNGNQNKHACAGLTFFSGLYKKLDARLIEKIGTDLIKHVKVIREQ